MRAPRRPRFSILLLALLASAAARAGEDGFHVNTGLSWHHDDNLLRVPDADPGFGGQRADNWREVDAGATFDHLYSRQRVQASVQLSKVAFEKFSQLNYDGKDARATWFWLAGNQFDGRLGGIYVELLAPYTDLRSNQRNLRVQHSAFFDGGWRLHPRWRLRAGYREDRYSYELASQRPNNRREESLEAGLDYVTLSGSEVGVVVRRLAGRYVYLRPFTQALDNFDQDEYRLRVNWLASAKTSVNLLAGRTTRTQNAFGSGRTSGLTGRLAVAYVPTAKTRIDAATWRDFAPLESSVVSYTLNRGASLGVAWQATSKIRASANVSYEKRDYNARNALPVSNRGTDLNDSLRTSGLTLTYAPLRKVQVALTVAQQVRGGSRALGIGAFRSTSAGISASIAF